MTTVQAISSVRMLLDEYGAEYFTDELILYMLERAQFSLAMRFWDGRRREFLLPLVRRALLNGDGQVGIAVDSTVSPSVVMLPVGLLVRGRDVPTAPLIPARWIDTTVYVRRAFINPLNGLSRSGQLQFTHYAGTLFHNGPAGDCEFTYVEAPYISNDQVPLAFADDVHTMIVDVAAAYLYPKDVDLPYREKAFGAADIVELQKENNNDSV